MRSRPADLSLAIMLAAGCTSASPSTTPEPASASSNRPDLPVSGEAYLVSYVDTDGPGFGVRVEAAAPTGVRRPIAALADVLPAGWVDAAPTDSFAPPIGPTRQIVLSAVKDVDADTTETRLLVVDLAGSGQPGVGVPINAFEPHWGPAGELAIAEQKPYLIDIPTGAKSEIKRPVGVDTLGQWLAKLPRWFPSAPVGLTGVQPTG